MNLIRSRRSTLLQYAKKIGCNAVAAFEPENIFYLTGFWGEAIAICSSIDGNASNAHSTTLISPKLESSRAEHTAEDCTVISTDRGTELISTFVSLISDSIVCTDCSDYSTIEDVRMKTRKKAIVVNTEPFFKARMIKDKSEMKTVAAASMILDSLFKLCTEEIRTGLSERELQAKLIFEGMKMGANPPSYRSTLNPLIIGGGPNGALPHAEITDRKFKKNDTIVVDLTLRYEGYIADATRTFALGSATTEMKKIYDIVRVAQQAGLDSINDNASCGEVDAACRNSIAGKGYASKFIHSTGHGIGLDVHEPPWLRMKSKELLKEGMTVTVEPGIYIQNKFGVRLEDSVIVTKRKVNNLNRFTKDLIVI